MDVDFQILEGIRKVANVIDDLSIPHLLIPSGVS